MSLLTLVQSVATELDISSPSTVVGNTNNQIIQLLRLANNEGKYLAARYRWQALINEATFTSAATESQGAMTTLAGASFGWLCNDTVWNRTQDRRMIPVSDVQWQQMKATSITGPCEYFRIRGGLFIVQPTMTASETVAFEWVSKNWCESSGGTDQSAWAADTDVGILDETVMAAGVLWRWKRAKGLDYAEDFNTYEALVADAAARDGAKKHIHMGAGRGSRFLNSRSGAEGNWTL